MKLYKYRSFNSPGTQDIVERDEIYLSSAEELNDPYDCRPIVREDYSEQEIKSYIELMRRKRPKDFPNDSEGLGKKNKEIYERFKKPGELRRLYYSLVDKYGIYSLSEVHDEMRMWSYYADKHRGICLEFDGPILIPNFAVTFRVRYSDKRAIIDMMKTSDDQDIREYFTAGLCTKLRQWEHEKEWRIIAPHHRGKCPIPSHYLSAVILGAKIPDRDIEAVVSWILKRKRPPAIWKAQIDYAKGAELSFKKWSPW